jgi:lipopolysaccharide/colanic/teichoic acid biosynthesis glycosyltransferase
VTIIPIAIKLYGSGLSIYKQVRLTKDRWEFIIYKFRSIRVDVEKMAWFRLEAALQMTLSQTSVGLSASAGLDELFQTY